MFQREKIWIAFESEHGFPNKAKPLNRTDVEHFADETDRSISSEPEWVEEFFEIQERLEDGSLLALHEIIDACEEAQIPLPVWAADELKRLVVAVITNVPIEHAGVGRSNSNVGKMREELKLKIRQDTVQKIRAYQALEPCLFAFLLLPTALKKLHEGKPLPDFGNTTADAIAHAAIALRGTFAQASEETIRKAYASPQRQGWRPWAFSRPDSLKAIGCNEEDDFVLPEGQQMKEFESENGLALPADIPSGMISATFDLDPISQRYVEQAQSFEVFNDFIEVERKRRRAKNR